MEPIKIVVASWRVDTSAVRLIWLLLVSRYDFPVLSTAHMISVPTCYIFLMFISMFFFPKNRNIGMAIKCCFYPVSWHVPPNYVKSPSLCAHKLLNWKSTCTHRSKIVLKLMWRSDVSDASRDWLNFCPSSSVAFWQILNSIYNQKIVLLPF